MLKLYHATNHTIAQPCPKQHRMYSDDSITGNRALGLFSNSDFTGAHVYGDRLYSFNLSDNARVLEIDDEMMQAGRCSAYYHGIRDTCFLFGYDAVRVTHEAAQQVVVLNFDMIENWTYVGETD